MTYWARISALSNVCVCIDDHEQDQDVLILLIDNPRKRYDELKFHAQCVCEVSLIVRPHIAEP
jgi:hypothetical protein